MTSAPVTNNKLVIRHSSLPAQIVRVNEKKETTAYGLNFAGEEEKMETQKFMVIIAKVVYWEMVASAMNHSNICSYIRDEFDKFVAENGLREGEFLPMATHSVGDRSWNLENDADPIFFDEESMNGGWFLFREEEVNWMQCISATSGSAITAQKLEDGRSWELTLQVPIMENEEPYKGCYWTAFHNAIQL